jgi:hypothetical protein
MVTENLCASLSLNLTIIIVDTKILPVQDQHLLESSREWNKVDIELYGNNRLVYACYDVSFIRSIHITMGITSKQIEVPLQLSRKTVVLKDVVYEPIVIGEANGEPLNSYFYREKRLASHFIKGQRFEFITNGQYERALKIFEEIIESGWFDHMWVYDPYFMDCSPEGGEKRINDIIKVLGKNNRLIKHIVFKAKSKEDAEQQFGQFQKAIQPTVSFLNKRGFVLNFTFYGTMEPFHDRFLFLINKNNTDAFRAFMLGTSFNSFGDSYSAIIELDPLDGKRVFRILRENVVSQNHIVLSREL